MKVLVTGEQGQIARSVAERWTGVDLTFAARPELDLDDPASIERTVASVNPDLILSAAAYTAVDRAEAEPDLAMAVNGIAPGVLGRAAKRAGARVIHMSTDYVFDGSSDRPWREDDPVSPVNTYGQSKLAGERALIESGADQAIIRTAWVYSPFGSNFVKAMLRLATERDEVSVVCDQIGCPTSAHDIAEGVLAIANAWLTDPTRGVGQVFHLGSAGATAWDGFARETFAISQELGGPHARVRPITTAEYPTAARRPANSRLDSARLAETFGYRAPDWRLSLVSVVGRLVGDRRC